MLLAICTCGIADESMSYYDEREDYAIVAGKLLVSFPEFSRATERLEKCNL